MTMNPRIGHLYHDHSISNAFTALDARESMRTREINAREAKQLEKYSHVIDRARNTCLKHNDLEQRSMRKSLEDIKSKTPSLAKSLYRETDRRRWKDFDRGKGYRGLNDPASSQSTRTKKIQSSVNPWSVFSQSYTHGGYSETDMCGTNDRTGFKSVDVNQISCNLRGGPLTRSEMLVRKAENITKALHDLYTKGLARKWRENNTTVLEILGKESKEELEKALFLLRGTATGDIIEDILKEKELVSKHSDNRNSLYKNHRNKSGPSTDVLITDMFGLDRDIADKGSHESVDSQNQSKNSDPSVDAEKVLLNLEDVISDQSKLTRWNRASNELTKMTDKTKHVDDKDVDISDIFEKDATWTMSSIIANPSENGLNPRTMKWTQLLKAPELWKTSTVKAAVVKKQKPVSLVTLAGKRRRTLLK